MINKTERKLISEFDLSSTFFLDKMLEDVYSLIMKNEYLIKDILKVDMHFVKNIPELGKGNFAIYTIPHKKALSILSNTAIHPNVRYVVPGRFVVKIKEETK